MYEKLTLSLFDKFYLLAGGRPHYFPILGSLLFILFLSLIKFKSNGDYGSTLWNFQMLISYLQENYKNCKFGLCDIIIIIKGSHQTND